MEIKEHMLIDFLVTYDTILCIISTGNIQRFMPRRLGALHTLIVIRLDIIFLQISISFAEVNLKALTALRV